LLGLVSLAIFLFIAFGPRVLVLRLTREDALVENAGALCFFVAGLLAMRLFLRSQSASRWWVLGWAVFCFFCFGEEISWFQRVVGYSTPEAVGNANVQGEMNIHNLWFLQGHFWGDALKGSFDWGIVLGAPNLFRIGFLFYFILLPLSVRMPRIGALLERFGYSPPGMSFVGAVSVVLLISLLLSLICEPRHIKALSETRESYYAFVILISLAWYPASFCAGSAGESL